jgi:ferredoxin/DMSO/TMAO reductase YedYZ heme-binding membrane subunit
VDGLVSLVLAQSVQDGGVRGMAQMSARMSYALMCLTITWGVFTATGWVRKLSGREPLRSGHMVLATLTLAFGGLHALAFLFLRDVSLSFTWISIPFFGGSQGRHALGIIGFETMLAIAISAGARRWLQYRSWLRMHQFAYPAFGLLILHSVFGAITNGTATSLIYLIGLTVSIPALTLTALRFTPPAYLARFGLVGVETGVAPATPQQKPPEPQLTVSVNNVLCHRYGYCEAEAPEVFKLVEDGRLRYEPRPNPREADKTRAAARKCPKRAIDLKERTS